MQPPKVGVPERSKRSALSRATRVLVVDDHPAIRLALVDSISQAPGLEVCGESATAVQSMELVHRLNPDVAVVDLSLEDSDGLLLVENIHIQHPGVKIVVFSMYDERLYAERVLRAGAVGYVMKTEPTNRVVDAIERVMRGEVYLSGSMAARILTKLAGRSTPSLVSAVSNLTDREMSVFQMLGEGYNIDEVADRLHLSPITVKHYRRSSREKLGARTNAELLYYAVEWIQGQARR